MEEAFQKISNNKARIYMDMIHTVKPVLSGHSKEDQNLFF